MNLFFYKKSFISILLVSVFIVQAEADGFSKMQKAMHTSPMPNLMMLVQMNAQFLKLDKDQVIVINNWKDNNKKPVETLMNQIIETEIKIKQSTLNGIEKLEFYQLKNTLLELRGKLIDKKYHCTSIIKKTLDDKQWSDLMTLRKQKLGAANAAKKEVNETQAFLRVSPMPKLMLIILMHMNELELSNEQINALENWRLKNMVHWSALFDQVLQTENKITQQALAMEAANKLMIQFDDMAEKRREMAQMSLACRDNMKTILTTAQWQQVVKLLNNYIDM